MKSVKGKLLKKLKTIKSIGYLKPERILHVNASDGYYEPFSPPKSTQIQTQNVFTEEDAVLVRERSFREQKPEIIDVSELMRDLEDDEIESDDDFNEKENIRPEIGVKNRGFFESDDEFNEKENIRPETGDENRGFSNPEKGKSEAVDSRFGEKRINPLSEIDENRGFSKPENGKSEAVESRFGGEKIDHLSEIDVSKFRRPDLDSGSLFDPNLLALFEQAVIEFKDQEAEKRARIKEKERDQDLIGGENEKPPLKAQKHDENRDPLFKNRDPLFDFEEKCPPGGSDSVILYTTGLRSIRKTFEDCHSVRFLLESFRVLFYERDISMHSEFREELWRIMGEKLVPPCLFIRGRYIGGAERVLGLHEQGKLRPLFEGVPIDRAEGPCDGCGGARFVVCFSCNGSHKVVVSDDVAAVAEICPECNENGLIICPLCC